MFYRRSQNNALVNLRKKCIRHYLDFNNSNINDEWIFCHCLYIYARVTVVDSSYIFLRRFDYCIAVS